MVQQAGDIFSLAWTSAAGFGDPLERQPRHVVEDLDNGYISRDWAMERYGVCVDQNGVLDTQQTVSLRQRIISERLSAAAPARGSTLPTLAARPEDLRVSEGLVISHCEEGAFFIYLQEMPQPDSKRG